LQYERDGPIESAETLENFNVEKAITSTLAVGRELCEDTDSAIHRFEMSWVEQLVERYRANPGRPIVHLSDLLDSTMVCIDKRASTILRESVNRFNVLPSDLRDWD
jgi:hypothetical protein